MIELVPRDVCNALGNDKPPSAGKAAIASKEATKLPEVIKVL